MSRNATPEIDIEEFAAARRNGLLVDVREPCRTFDEAVTASSSAATSSASDRVPGPWRLIR